MAQQPLRPQQRGDSLSLCNNGMHGPAATRHPKHSTLQPARLGLAGSGERMPLLPLCPQQRGDSFNLFNAQMHVPAATAFPATHLPGVPGRSSAAGRRRAGLSVLTRKERRVYTIGPTELPEWTLETV